MKFKMQVRLPSGRYLDVSPYEGQRTPKAYKFDSREEAERMLRLCYPDELMKDRISGTPGHRARVVEAEDETGIRE